MAFRRSTPMSANNKIMDLLARRDHSERELRVKLGRKYPPNEVEAAIQRARDENWLSDPQDLSERVAASLHRKNKGYRYIANYLRQKGLPAVPKDAELEFEKAFAMIRAKFPSDQDTFEDKQRIARFLTSRGFDDDTIRRTLYEKL